MTEVEQPPKDVADLKAAIEQVMTAQSDLVDIVARFDPKIVKMCPSDEKVED